MQIVSFLLKANIIHINLDEQSMYVFKNDELYKTYLVSGGKAVLPPPSVNGLSYIRLDGVIVTGAGRLNVPQG